MTFDEAKQLRQGQIIYHVSLKNADKSALRARVNGQVKLWKTRPNEIQVPMKHGLRDCFYLTQDNLKDWSLNEKMVETSKC